MSPICDESNVCLSSRLGTYLARGMAVIALSELACRARTNKELASGTVLLG